MADDVLPRTMYEFQVAGVTGDLPAALAPLGRDGWQVVQLLPQPTGQVLVLCQRELTRARIVAPSADDTQRVLTERVLRLEP